MGGMGRWVGWGRVVGGGGQAECERRIEVFVKIQKKNKKNWGEEGLGVRGRVGGSGWM